MNPYSEEFGIAIERNIAYLQSPAFRSRPDAGTTIPHLNTIMYTCRDQSTWFTDQR